MYRKKTLRRMQPITRRYARHLNTLQGILKRLQNLTEDIARMESDSTALFNQREVAKLIDNAEPANLDEFMSDHFNDEETIPEHTPIDKATEILFCEEDSNEL